MCGEQAKVAAKKLKGKGSPPRVRGTVNSLDDFDSYFGITPACAGNSPGRFACGAG